MVSLVSKILRQRCIFLFVWLLIDTWNIPRNIANALRVSPAFGAISTTVMAVNPSGGKLHNHKHSFVPSSLRSSVQDSASSSIEEEPLKLGFIGCGTIASAIATGLLTQTTKSISNVYVSKRSESKSSLLAQTFPDRVTVMEAENNQQIVDSCDILFICVLPTQEESVLSSLSIPQDKVLVSLVATSKLHKLVETTNLEPKNVYKMICLPPVAKLQGTCIMVPPDQTSYNIQALFSTLGGDCIECETEAIMDAMMIPGCLMGPIYGLMKQNRDWLIRQGVPAKDASYFVGRQYLSIVQDAERLCDDENHFDDLIAEQTPGGLNEQSLRNLQNAGFLDRYDDAMDAIFDRLTGKSDGSMEVSTD